MNFDNKVLDELTQRAKESPRLRMNLDLRNSPEDGSQRMLNALEPGTVLPIHRHRTTSEVVVMLRGRAVQYLYDEQGRETDAVLLAAGALDGDGVPGAVPGMTISKGQWHKLVALESGTVIFEAKDGPYEPIGPEDILSM
jgi:cupin fold WbuC family metalloprotein